MLMITRPFVRDGFFIFYYQKGGIVMSDVVKFKFPDGAVKEFPNGTTTEEVAASISPGLKKKAIAGKLNGKLVDLSPSAS